ncbi:hypothetical protein ABEB36_002493 [Hypothenemus hampei]|uniref:Uncharacterized protein n=1 Tax=Hypothenemus hampei TaxID=57062 RepID=A0ABD1F8J7_HYPHA
MTQLIEKKKYGSDPFELTNVCKRNICSTNSSSRGTNPKLADIKTRSVGPASQPAKADLHSMQSNYGFRRRCKLRCTSGSRPCDAILATFSLRLP